jgi:putative hydrolase of the HAD superfamily
MTDLPRAILLDLDDTILSAVGQSAGQWQRVIADFAEHLDPHPPDDVIAAIQAYSKYLWADEARHKHWRHQIGEARRHYGTKQIEAIVIYEDSDWLVTSVIVKYF